MLPAKLNTALIIMMFHQNSNFTICYILATANNKKYHFVIPQIVA